MGETTEVEVSETKKTDGTFSLGINCYSSFFVGWKCQLIHFAKNGVIFHSGKGDCPYFWCAGDSRSRIFFAMLRCRG